MAEHTAETYSRHELLSWINETLKQLGTGAVYCQLIDVCFPGKVALHKLNWKAKHDYEFMNNFKILQQAFNKLDIQKRIEVEKLIKTKYQDNLEFVQWIKKYYDVNFTIKDYDPIQKRGNVEVDFNFLEKIPKNIAGKDSGVKLMHSSAKKNKENNNNFNNNNSILNLSACKIEKSEKLSVKNNANLSFPCIEKHPVYQSIEAERDFYFDKLSEIDHLLDVFTEMKKNDINELISGIQKILYNTPDQLVNVNEDGTIEIKKNIEEKILIENTRNINLNYKDILSRSDRKMDCEDI